jgi:hypothetical protein
LTNGFGRRAAFLAECLQQLLGLLDDAIELDHRGFGSAGTVLETLCLCGHEILLNYAIQGDDPPTLRLRRHRHCQQMVGKRRQLALTVLSAIGATIGNCRAAVGSV